MGLTQLEHLLVLTDDIDGTRDFYRDVLDFAAGDRPPLPFPGHWLYLGDVACVHVADRAAYTAHARTLGLSPARASAGTGAIDHVAFNGRDYDAIVARLQRHGVPAVRNEIPQVGLRQLFVKDPNGVTIEINVLG